MPQDGSNNYYYPPGTRGIPDQTIESEAYNTFLDDLVVNDLNTPRPIHRGGTGANNALAAILALNGEIARQLVTNYSTHPWVNGSFYSAAGATDAPLASTAFVGEFYQNLAGDHATIHARANTPIAGQPFGKMYIKQKIAGVWQSTWTLEDKPLDDAKVNRVGGDTMTGMLTIDMTNPVVSLNKTASGGTAYIAGGTATKARWAVALGDVAAEGGTQAGSNFAISRYTNLGGLIDVPFSISRETGAVSMPGTLTVGGTINTTGTATFSGPLTATAITASSTLTVSGVTTLNGAIAANNDITVKRTATPTTGYIFYGNTGTKYLGFNGTQFDMVGGGLTVHNGPLNGSASISAGTSMSVGTTLSVGSTISGSGALVIAGHATLGNGTVNGGVLYMNAANSDYIQASGFVLNYRGQTILHSGNYTSYFPAAVTSQYWAYVGDSTFFAFADGGNYRSDYGAHTVVTGMWSGGSSGHGARYRALYNWISGVAYVVGAAS